MTVQIDALNRSLALKLLPFLVWISGKICPFLLILDLDHDIK